MPLLVWSTGRAGSRTQFSWSVLGRLSPLHAKCHLGMGLQCKTPGTTVLVQGTDITLNPTTLNPVTLNPWESWSSQGLHFWSPDPSTSLAEAGHIQPELSYSHFCSSIFTRNTSLHLKYFLLKANPLAGLVGNFLGGLLNHWVVWPKAELGPLAPVSQWRISVHKQVNLVEPHPSEPLLHQPTWAWARRIFSFPSVTSLLLPPYSSHSFVSKDARVSFVFSNPYKSRRIKWWFHPHWQ